jgi:hypothetical protein
MLPGGPVPIPPRASPTYSWPVSASSAGPLRVVEVMAALDVLEAAAASSREGRAVRLDGGGG